MAKHQPQISVVRRGIGLCGLMFIILFLLKVGVVKTEVMAWSWLWIALPLWWPLGILLLIGVIALACFLCYLFIILVMGFIASIRKRVKRDKTTS